MLRIKIKIIKNKSKTFQKSWKYLFRKKYAYADSRIRISVIKGNSKNDGNKESVKAKKENTNKSKNCKPTFR